MFIFGGARQESRGYARCGSVLVPYVGFAAGRVRRFRTKTAHEYSSEKTVSTAESAAR
jgi:hypothetical protein